jgi:hypothetical protein
MLEGDETYANKGDELFRKGILRQKRKEEERLKHLQKREQEELAHVQAKPKISKSAKLPHKEVDFAEYNRQWVCCVQSRSVSSDAVCSSH